MSKKSKIIRLNAIREKRIKEEKVSTSINCKESLHTESRVANNGQVLFRAKDF